MESLTTAFFILVLLIFYLGLGVWVFAGLLLVSFSGLIFLLDMPIHRIGTIMAPLIIRSATSWELSAIPMFVWMGEIMFRTDISNRLFRGLSHSILFTRQTTSYKCYGFGFICSCKWI